MINLFLDLFQFPEKIFAQFRLHLNGSSVNYALTILYYVSLIFMKLILMKIILYFRSKFPKRELVTSTEV